MYSLLLNATSLYLGLSDSSIPFKNTFLKYILISGYPYTVVLPVLTDSLLAIPAGALLNTSPVDHYIPPNYSPSHTPPSHSYAPFNLVYAASTHSLIPSTNALYYVVVN